MSDPNKDRVVKTVKPPPHQPISRQLLFPDKLKNKPDWKLLRDHLQKEGRLAKEELLKLIADTNKLFRNEGNLLYKAKKAFVVVNVASACGFTNSNYKGLAQLYV